MSNFLSVQFWFNQRPDLLSPASAKVLIGLIIIFSISFIVAAILRLKKDFYARFWGKLTSFSISNALIGAALFFFCQQLIPLLSSRFWFILWGAGLFTWTVFIILYVKKIPTRKQKFLKEKDFKKYLP